MKKTTPRADLATLQREVAEWTAHNFGQCEDLLVEKAAVAASEVGELCSAIVKRHQHIRLHEDQDALAADAVGDTVIALAGICEGLGIDLWDTVAKVWGEVRQRDWKRDPERAHLGGQP